MGVRRKKRTGSSNSPMKVEVKNELCQELNQPEGYNPDAIGSASENPGAGSTDVAYSTCSSQAHRSCTNAPNPTPDATSSQISQIKLIAMACSNDIGLKLSYDDKCMNTYRRRNMRRATVTEGVSKTKNKTKYHRNNFHFTLRDKWSKLVTDKISALAFSRSLYGHQN